MDFIVKLLDARGGGKNLPAFSSWLLSCVKGYNRKKYWHRRAKLVNPNSGTPLFIKLYYLFYIKRMDGKNHCSFGTGLNYGASFATPPFLPHGPHGIIVGHDAKIGSKCIIFHQVTISGGNVIIGDHVTLGAGSKVLPNVTIGNYCKIGANAVVVENMPDHSTCVMQKPRIILKNNFNKINEKNTSNN